MPDLPPLAGGRVVAVRPDDEPGRAAAGALAEPMTPRPDLVGVQGPRPGSGRTDGQFWEGDRWFAKSRGARIFADAELAARELERLAAVKAQLGVLAPSPSVVVWTEGAAGHQIWTVAPRLVTLRERLDASARIGRWGEFDRVLTAFATALGEAMTWSREAGLGLDANPSNFAIQGGRLRYIDDDVTATRDGLGVEDGFVARLTEYQAAPRWIWDGFARRVADELIARVPAPERPRFAARLAAAATLRPGSVELATRVRARLEATP